MLPSDWLLAEVTPITTHKDQEIKWIQSNSEIVIPRKRAQARQKLPMKENEITWAQKKIKG